MRALDLFRGAGGWSVACQRLGIEDHGVEIMPQANETAAAAGHRLAYENVWEPDGKYGHYDRLIASPPCQTFSLAGKGRGRDALDVVLDLIPRVSSMGLATLRHRGSQLTGDERTALVLSPPWYALNYAVDWIAWEQVPTVLPVWEACAGELEGRGFSVWTGNLQAEMHGVPQTRKRAFLLASRVKDVAPPVPTHSRYYPRSPERLDPGVEKWVSMAEALGWGMSVPPSEIVQNRQIGSGMEGRYGKPKDRTADQPSYTMRGAASAAAPGGGYVLTSEHPEWPFKRPSTTIVGTFKPEIVAAPGYRTTVSRQNQPDSVRVTVEEAGILQSFPADYPWRGAKGKRFLQVGNAVPPLLAEAVLSAVSS